MNRGRRACQTPSNVFWGALCLLAAAGLACGCARLPELRPAAGVHEAAEAGTACQWPFPDRPWRAVHALTIDGPFGHRQSVLGVTVVDPQARRLRAVVLSLEGIVLFDASGGCGDDVSVHRALPPLDRKGFPEGLLRDVSFLFLAPPGPPARTGLDPEGRLVCRWLDEREGTLDLMSAGPGAWRVRQYDARRRLRREALVSGGPPAAAPLAAEIRLSGRGLVPYAMDLTLVEADFLRLDDASLFTAPPSP